MSQDYVKVLEAAGLTEAARIIAAMGEAKPNPTAQPEENNEATLAAQQVSPAEAESAALLAAMHAAGIGAGWVSAGPLVEKRSDR